MGRVSVRLRFCHQYQTGKKNDKADAITEKPNERPVDDTHERREHMMQALLPQSCIGMHPIDVEDSAEEEDEVRNPTCITSPTDAANVLSTATGQR